MFVKIVFLLAFSCLGLNVQFCRAADNPNLIGNKGIQLIQKGKIDEGLDLIRQAIQIDPQMPDWHMTYGSMLFIKGQKIFQSGNAQEAREIFKVAEKELLLAVQLFKQTDNVSISQCYFLVGDIYNYAYVEKDEAKSFYEKSLEFYPEHGGAKSELNRL